MKIRRPVVAGRFYPGNPEDIEAQLNKALEKESPTIDRSLSQKNILGGVVPHAGYMFSSFQAMHFFEILKLSHQQFDTFIIINPNHTGYGAEISLDDNDAWETPLGEVLIDKDFYRLLDFDISEDAHKLEHSGEVLVPMLQYTVNTDFKIVPITISLQNRVNAELIADAIIRANETLNRKVCLIASSDFSHYVEAEVGEKLDSYVIDEILNFNPSGVFQQVKDRDISVCGFGPIMTLMYYAMKIADKPKVKVLKKGNSGEIIPSSEVVDYVSMLFFR